MNAIPPIVVLLPLLAIACSSPFDQADDNNRYKFYPAAGNYPAIVFDSRTGCLKSVQGYIDKAAAIVELQRRGQLPPDVQVALEGMRKSNDVRVRMTLPIALAVLDVNGPTGLPMCPPPKK